MCVYYFVSDVKFSAKLYLRTYTHIKWVRTAEAIDDINETYKLDALFSCITLKWDPRRIIIHSFCVSQFTKTIIQYST